MTAASSPRHSRSIVWLRRDLRLRDNVALYEAASCSQKIAIAFVIDPQLLRSDRVGAPIVQAFFCALNALREHLQALGSDVVVLQGDFAAELARFARAIGAGAVYFNEDYEPQAIRRDTHVSESLRAAGVEARSSLDHVYFAAEEVVSSPGHPYKVYTPYRRRWMEQRAVAPRGPVPSFEAISGKLIGRAELGESLPVPRPQEWGFQSSPAFPVVSEMHAQHVLDAFTSPEGGIDAYRDHRNFPALPATSMLSPQLRAGTIGIRTCFERAFETLEERDRGARSNIEAWIGELVWREFYQMVLKWWPHVAGEPFLPAANDIAWRSSPADFDAWCAGMTGYPMVDAAMRQLNTTGWMHNRLRMIVASFLTKDLLIDWRQGERYFEQHLADADLASNNGGWQWAASTGTDAAPYFRIFNPVLQSRKFDCEGAFIRSMLPELQRIPTDYVHEPWTMPPLEAAAANLTIGEDYPAPIVDHFVARQRALSAFSVLGKGSRT